MAYEYKSKKSGKKYTLYTREVKLKGGKKQTIYFFKILSRFYHHFNQFIYIMDIISPLMAERKKKKTVKNWYSLLAPSMFGKAKIAETPADDPDKVLGRVVEVSMQELTGDFARWWM